MHASTEKTGLYGLMAEFDSAQAIVDASTRAVAAGYTRLEAYTPFPIEELNDIIHKKRTILPKLVLTAAFAGMGTGFALQVLGLGDRVPAERRRPAAGHLAGVRRAVLRADDSLRGADRRHRHDRAERAAAALPPGVQRRALHHRLVGQVLPGDRGRGRALRQGRRRSGSCRGWARRESTTLRNRRDGAARSPSCVDGVGGGGRCRQDMHDTPRYEVYEASRLRRRARVAQPAGRHRGPRPAARRRVALHRQGRRRCRPTAFPFADRRRPRCSAAGSASTSTARRATGCSAMAGAWWCSAGCARRRATTRSGCSGALPGYFFDVITNGFGAMQGYAEQIPPRDRWLIAAYVRALQLSQNAIDRRRAGGRSGAASTTPARPRRRLRPRRRSARDSRQRLRG